MNISLFSASIIDCHIYDGKGWQDSSGAINTLEQVSGVPSAQHCMENACYNHSECVAFTYVASLNRCDLKTSAQSVSFGSVPSGIMSARSPKSCVDSGELLHF